MPPTGVCSNPGGVAFCTLLRSQVTLRTASEPQLRWHHNRILLVALVVISIIVGIRIATLDEDIPYTAITLHRDGINSHFKTSSWSNLDATLRLSRSTFDVIDEAQMDLRNYLIRHSLELCTTQEEFQAHFETAYSLLPRLTTMCSQGRMRLAMTPESLSQYLSERRDDYCFSFVETSSALSKKIIVASPDFAVNRGEFASAVYGLVFPFWPIYPTTLIVPAPKFLSDLTLSDPYNRKHLLGADLGYIGNGTATRTPDIVRRLSTSKDASISITNANDIICFPNGIPPMDIKPHFLPCFNAGEILRISAFCLVVVDDWSSLTSSAVRSIHAQLWSCFMFHSIPVIPTEFDAVIAEVYLPFFYLLQPLWTEAVVFQSFHTNQVDFLRKLRNINLEERIRRLNKGAKLFNRHLRTVGKQVETAVAQLNRVLFLPQPTSPVIRTRFTAEIPGSYIPIYELNAISNDRKLVSSDALGEVVPICNAQPRADFEGPLWVFDSTPWTSCDKITSGCSKKFTVIILTYDRISIFLKNLLMFDRIEHLLESIIVVWNHQVLKPELYQWPKLKVPIHVVRTPVNKLQNRFLPFDLIKTDCVLTVDDEVIPDPKALETGFRVWLENRDRIVGFVARGHDWLNWKGQFHYRQNPNGPYSLILTGASFFHKYYLYAYTFELPHEIYSTVNELMNCEDLAMNMLSQQISEHEPYRISTVTRFKCLLCKSGLSMKSSHYKMRSLCITNFIHIFGYDPLKSSTFTCKIR
ncbi:unnamed protein product [Rodentolepis nana]|uniref:Glyco_transf_64 domain-containing protein n=1 Tax=Rodentolepis nana TaxID=102285 RepID=A0A0R3T2E3_RODNA|nr:unnamed protein product [Rodentolepis nana]